MALLQAIKQGVLASLRVPVAHQAAAPTSLFLLRGFAADASYLDKKDVTERVLNTVKGFEKVDAGAVSGGGRACGLGGGPQAAQQPFRWHAVACQQQEGLGRRAQPAGTVGGAAGVVPLPPLCAGLHLLCPAWASVPRPHHHHRRLATALPTSCLPAGEPRLCLPEGPGSGQPGHGGAGDGAGGGVCD